MATAPAGADYQSAVEDYEQGAYQSASRELRKLVEQGDEQARNFLQRMGEEGLLGSGESSETPGGAASGQGAPSPTGSRSRSGGSDYGIEMPWRNWSLGSDGGRPDVGWSVVWPSRRSLLSTLFHMPADVTMIGLQHVARSLEADALDRDLRSISRGGNRLVFLVLAVWWWFLLLKASWAIGRGLLGYARAIFVSLGLVTNE